MQTISFSEHISYETMLRKINLDRDILGIVKRRKTSYMGRGPSNVHGRGILPKITVIIRNNTRKRFLEIVATHL